MLNDGEYRESYIVAKVVAVVFGLIYKFTAVFLAAIHVYVAGLPLQICINVSSVLCRESSFLQAIVKNWLNIH
jgi:hypothetical protein